VKVLVCGSRIYKHRADGVRRRLNELPRDTEIIHGNAEGPDRIAHEWAYGVHVLHIYPADWQRHGRRAGYVRNVRMLEEQKPDLVLAFWDGRSNGTGHTIREAEKRAIPVEVVSL